MSPAQRAFLTTVLRYQALLHERRPDPLVEVELGQLEAVLASRSTGAVERRRHRRIRVELPGTLRARGVVSPCRVVDLGGGGLRLLNDRGPALRRAERVVVSLSPTATGLRIDLPAVVVGPELGKSLGLQFCGPPVLGHARNAALAPTPRLPPGTPTVQTPMAKPTSTRQDLAA